MQIQDIHTKNKNQIKEANARAGQITDMVLSKSLTLAHNAHMSALEPEELKKKSSTISATSEEEKTMARKGKSRQFNQIFVPISKSVKSPSSPAAEDIEFIPSNENESLEKIELTEEELE